MRTGDEQRAVESAGSAAQSVDRTVSGLAIAVNRDDLDDCELDRRDASGAAAPARAVRPLAGNRRR